jgi:hypothetical protein
MTFSVNFIVADSEQPLDADGAPPATADPGAAFLFVPNASGGTPPYVWSISGTLLAGFTFTPATGALVSAAANTPGTMTLTWTVTDAIGQTAVLGPFDIEALPEVIEPPVDPEPATGVYYVNPETGNDASDGLTPATAWRNAPGAQNGATGVALATTLLPGETLRFIGGTRLGKTLFLPFGGTEANPVIYESWSASGPLSRCLLDAADPVTLVRPAESQEDAGGAANWSELHVVVFDPTGSNALIYRLYDDFGIIPISRFPELDSPLFEGDIGPNTTGRHVDVPSDMASLGEIVSPVIADICRDQVGYARLNLRRQNELITRATVSAVSGDSTFASGWTEGLALYSTTTRAYVTNSRHHCTLPGRFATIAPGKAVVKLRGSVNIRIGRERQCVDVRGQSHVVVRGFDWTGFTRAPALRCTGADAVNVMLTQNYIHDGYNERAFGVNGNTIDRNRISGCILHRNRFVDLVQMGACRMGGAVNFRATENVMHRIGSAALSTSGGDLNTIWARNIISEVRGIHANNVSLYQDSIGALVEDNFMFGCDRSMTFQGEAGGVVVHNHIIRRNVFFAEQNWSALWENGRTMSDVLIEGNVAVAVRGHGIYITRDNINITIRNNLSNTLEIRASTAGDNFLTWTVEGNQIIPRSWITSNGFLTADHCRMEGPGGIFYELDLRDVAPVA